MTKHETTKDPLWLDWRGPGYYAIAREPPTNFPHEDPLARSRDAWLSAFQHARRGDFRYVPQLAGLVGVAGEQLDYNTVAQLIGDAAPATGFGALREFIASNHWNFELTFAWCRALSLLGRLGDVPLMIDAYEANIVAGSDEQDIILTFIEEIIDDDCGLDFGGMETYASIEDYRELVLEHCRELAARHGGEDVLLWHGKPRSVRRVAADLLAAAHGNVAALSLLRCRFEAWTGIDCSPMFGPNGTFVPLAAAAIVEDFLDGPAVEQYHDGHRYFFGYPVP